MAIVKFFLQKLIQYDEEFMEFFENPSAVIQIDHRECNYFPEKSEIAVEPSEPEAWTLLKNDDGTYLLVEYKRDEQKWRSYFSRDPYGALDEINSSIRNWHRLFPIIRAAHMAAHLKVERDPDLGYIQKLMSDAYHSVDPQKALQQKITELETGNNPSPSTAA